MPEMIGQVMHGGPFDGRRVRVSEHASELRVPVGGYPMTVDTYRLRMCTDGVPRWLHESVRPCAYTVIYAPAAVLLAITGGPDPTSTMGHDRLEWHGYRPAGESLR